MRVTQEGMIHSTLHRLQQRLEQVEEVNSKLASGKRVRRGSDDPAGTNRALLLRASQRAREQELRNAEDGRTWLQLSDSKLQAAGERLHRAQELAVRAANVTNSEEREAIRADLTAIRDELVAIANTRHEDRPLFAGFGDGDAVWFDGGTGEWVSRGDGKDPQDAITRRVGDDEHVRVNVTAHEAFNFDGASPAPDVLTTLDNLITAIDEQKQADVDQAMGDLESGRARLDAALAEVGANANRIESAMRRNEDEQLALRGELADVEDVELTSAVMELQTQEVAYQATLGALSRVLQPSLVEFLR